jgi:hypothetical protein
VVKYLKPASRSAATPPREPRDRLVRVLYQLGSAYHAAIAASGPSLREAQRHCHDQLSAGVSWLVPIFVHICTRFVR